MCFSIHHLKKRRHFALGEKEMKAKNLIGTLGLAGLLLGTVQNSNAQSNSVVQKWYSSIHKNAEYADSLLDLFDKKMYSETRGVFALAIDPKNPISIFNYDGNLLVEITYNKEGTQGYDDNGYYIFGKKTKLTDYEISVLVELNEEVRKEEIEVDLYKYVEFAGNPLNYDGTKRNTNVFWPSKEFFNQLTNYAKENKSIVKTFWGNDRTEWIFSDNVLNKKSSQRECLEWFDNHKNDVNKLVYVKDVLKLIGYDIKEDKK